MAFDAAAHFLDVGDARGRNAGCFEFGGLAISQLAARL